MGDVIFLPLHRCESCAHFATRKDDEGLVSSFCRNWDEPIDDERVAAECPDYEQTTRKASS